MDYGMLQGAVRSLKAAADIAVNLRKTKTASEVHEKSIELRHAIDFAHDSAFAAMSDQLPLFDTDTRRRKD